MNPARQSTPGTVEFESLTRALLDPSNSDSPSCPKCGESIDFNEKVEWMGPTAFVCNSCQEIVELSELDNM